MLKIESEYEYTLVKVNSSHYYLSVYYTCLSKRGLRKSVSEV